MNKYDTDNAMNKPAGHGAGEPPEHEGLYSNLFEASGGSSLTIGDVCGPDVQLSAGYGGTFNSGLNSRLVNKRTKDVPERVIERPIEGASDQPVNGQFYGEARAALDLPDANSVIRRASYDILSRREHSCLELRRKLNTRLADQYSVDQIDSVIEALAEEGLQSDFRFADCYTRSRYSRGDGPLKIKAALQERGVHGGLIESTLTDEQFDWQAKAQAVYCRKFGGVRSAEGDYTAHVKQRAKEMRFMQSRGFPTHMLSVVFDEA